MSRRFELNIAFDDAIKIFDSLESVWLFNQSNHNILDAQYKDYACRENSNLIIEIDTYAATKTIRFSVSYRGYGDPREEYSLVEALESGALDNVPNFKKDIIFNLDLLK